MFGINSGLHISNIFDKAIEIEKKTGRIYERFAELFSDFPKIADFWKGMNKDELNHAEWLSEIKETLLEKQLLSTPNYELILKVENVKFLLNKNSAKKTNNLDEAYKIAIEIETSQENYLFGLLTNSFVSSEKRKKFLLSEIDKHQQKIMDFPKNFGDKNSRRKIEAKEENENSQD